MSNVLGKVALQSLEEPRGADVTLSVRVPASWLATGETIEVELPRNLACAHCDGGGCDVCERAGAVSLRERQAPPESLRVSLPTHEAAEAGKSIVLRIPARGGFAADADRPRGLLMLKVTGAAEADDNVRLVSPPAHRELRAPPEVVLRSLVIAIVLVVLFVLMLRLSGWL